jgi:Zn-dependent M28 family amino/carboxypeptidase
MNHFSQYNENLIDYITKKPKKYSTYNYVFVALTGEEQNQLGAEYFVESTPFYTEPNAVINLDMIGHLDSNQKEIFIQGINTAPGWSNILAATKIWKRKIKKVNTSYSSKNRSDFNLFYQKGAPSINITTGNQPYTNTPNDTPDKINYGGEAFIIRYLTKTLRNIDKSTILNLREELIPETQK